MLAVGMQIEPVAMRPPDRTDLIGFFQHDDVQTLPLHCRGTGWSRRTRTQQ